MRDVLWTEGRLSYEKFDYLNVFSNGLSLKIQQENAKPEQVHLLDDYQIISAQEVILQTL